MRDLVLEFVVRTALVAIATGVVLRLLRVRSAGARHAAWLGVLAVMLLLPAWTQFGPRMALRLLPSTPATATPPTLPFPTALSFAPMPSGPATSAAHPWNWGVALVALYVSISMALLARLVLGTIHTRILVRRASLRDGHLTSGDCASPVTVGLFHPVPILPEGWTAWPPAQLEAVLVHEREHVRRRDPLVQWIAIFNRAVFWFHPLAWWLERRLSTLAEAACDAAVLSRGCDPIDYSGYLLEISRAIGQSGSRVKLLGMAMAGRPLSQRIRQIVEHAPAPRITRGRALGLALACTTVSVVLAAATVDRQEAPPSPPSPPPPPAPVAVFDVPAPPAPPLAPNPPTPPAAPLPPAPPAPQDQPAPRFYPFAQHRLIALCFDLRGISADAQVGALAAASSLVRRDPGSAELFSVMAYRDGQLRVLEDFTAERERIVNAIQRLAGNPGDQISAEQRLAILQAATQMLSPLAGKKNLVYIGSPAAFSGGADVNALIADAIRADVAFFPINVSAPATPRPDK